MNGGPGWIWPPRYRLMAHFGVNDLTYNHISARVPGEPDCMLIKPEDQFFDEVTASGLGKYKLDGTPISDGAVPQSGPVLTIHAGILWPSRISAALSTPTRQPISA